MQCQWHHWAVYSAISVSLLSMPGHLVSEDSNVEEEPNEATPSQVEVKMKMLPVQRSSVASGSGKCFFMPSFVLACLYSCILLCKSLTLCVLSVVCQLPPLKTIYNCPFEMLLLTFRQQMRPSIGLQNKRLRKRTRQ